MITYELQNQEKAFIKIDIETGKFAGQSLMSHNLQPCMDLTCGCGNIYFQEDKTGKIEGMPYSLDVQERMVVRISETDISSDENNFCLALTDAIPEENWFELFQFYFSLKSTASEVVPVEELNVEFKNYHEIIRESLLVSYKEKLPWAMNMFVEVNQKVYEIEDYYCVQPNCDCKEVQLVVFNDENENSLLSLWYNYAAKTLQIDETHEKSTPSEAILAEIKQKYEKVLTLNLPNRHARLRKMFNNFIEKQGIYPLSGAAKANSNVGRNAPCPCGSGKKYKVCCGA